MKTKLLTAASGTNLGKTQPHHFTFGDLDILSDASTINAKSAAGNVIRQCWYATAQCGEAPVIVNEPENCNVRQSEPWLSARSTALC